MISTLVQTNEMETKESNIIVVLIVHNDVNEDPQV